MVDMTLIRPLNKGQGHSFWYQSISYMNSYRLSIVHRLATIHSVQTDNRRNTLAKARLKMLADLCPNVNVSAARTFPELACAW